MVLLCTAPPEFDILFKAEREVSHPSVWPSEKMRSGC